ncbi:hypothetical protein ACFL6C_07135 [Myxococcota bacterium]
MSQLIIGGFHEGDDKPPLILELLADVRLHRGTPRLVRLDYWRQRLGHEDASAHLAAHLMLLARTSWQQGAPVLAGQLLLLALDIAFKVDARDLVEAHRAVSQNSSGPSVTLPRPAQQGVPVSGGKGKP